jgi:hypothetical protein
MLQVYGQSAATGQSTTKKNAQVPVVAQQSAEDWRWGLALLIGNN